MQLPLILVRFQRNSGEPSGPSKNDPEGQRTRSGPELRRNGRFYVRPKSVFWPKNGSYPKKSPKMTFPPLIIWAKALFFFEQLCPVVARTWLGLKSERLFLGPKSRFLAKNLPYHPNFGQRLVCSPRRDRSFPTLGTTFPSRVTAVFVKKKKNNRLTRQKVFPLPTVRALSASNSPSALSAQALRARALG